MSDIATEPNTTTPHPPPPVAKGWWWQQGVRSAWLLRPRWPVDAASPALVLGLMVAATLWQVLMHRLYIEGPATFYWPALMSGWFPTAVGAWVCWVLTTDRAPALHERAPSASALFVVYAAQTLALSVIVGFVYMVLMRLGVLRGAEMVGWTAWLVWWSAMLWFIAAQGLLFWRAGRGTVRRRGACVALLLAVAMASVWMQPLRLWYPDAREDAAAEVDKPLALTPAALDAQMGTLPKALAALGAQRPGVVDVYALTYAPYAGEDVFLRESRMVAGVIEERFDARGRSLQLVNHKSTIETQPWATPANLARALGEIGARMDRDEDILFIHLTSHGAKSGRLSVEFWPLQIEAMTPEALKAALDSAGIRHRVISVSACYSGSWLAPLADERTLVMTAADADHTSFGCGRGSELTYFGRAVFDEALRGTRSFESAHASARNVIEQREKDAGKKDGFSNPQIHVGKAIREQLTLLEKQLGALAR
jgi:Peptidase C13 family